MKKSEKYAKRIEKRHTGNLESDPCGHCDVYA